MTEWQDMSRGCLGRDPIPTKPRFSLLKFSPTDNPPLPSMTLKQESQSTLPAFPPLEAHSKLAQTSPKTENFPWPATS